MFYILIVLVVTLLHIFVKAHQTVYLQCVHFVVCKLYLNKVDLKNPLPYENPV